MSILPAQQSFACPISKLRGERPLSGIGSCYFALAAKVWMPPILTNFCVSSISHDGLIAAPTSTRKKAAVSCPRLWYYKTLVSKNQAATKFRLTPFRQWRLPVGAGPSLKMWPKWLPQRRQCTSVRIRKRKRSSMVRTALGSDYQNDGQPVPLSYLVLDEYTARSQPAQW